MSDVLVLHSPSMEETSDISPPRAMSGDSYGTHSRSLIWDSVVICYLCQHGAGVNWRQRDEVLLWKNNFDRKESTPVLT